MLGEAGRRVVLEECLQGDELSFLVLSDGERVAPLVAAQDHKRIGDGDTGPNTGGMGAYSTADHRGRPDAQWLLQHVARPVVAGMKAEGAEYKGILYCGLMMTARGPMVLEFNCRFGDPETQPILMRLESDLLEALEASIEGRVSEGDFRWSPDASVCVVMSSGGYPGTYEVGKKIMGLEDAGKDGGRESLSCGHDPARRRFLHRGRTRAGRDVRGRRIWRPRWIARMRRRRRSALKERITARTLRPGRLRNKVVDVTSEVGSWRDCEEIFCECRRGMHCLMRAVVSRRSWI